MKKMLLTVIAMLLLACAMTSLFSCSQSPVECDEHDDKDNDGTCDVCGAEVEQKCAAHKDENADKLCDLCATEFFPRCSEHSDENVNGKCDVCGKAVLVEITVSLCDQEGAYIPGVTVIFTDSEYEEYIFVTDSDGRATVELYTGTYRVTYDTTSDGVYFPVGYLPIPSTVEISASEKNVTVEITKTVPNGEASRPFPLSSDTSEIVIPAATKYHYIIYHASGRKIKLVGESFEVVYNDSTYNSSLGEVNFILAEDGADEHSFLTIENLSADEITLSFSLYSDPGTYGNPYIIEEVGTVTNANFSANKSVYYKWIADKNGTVCFSTAQIYVFKSASLSVAYPIVKTSGDANSLQGVYSVAAEGVEYTITVDAETVTVLDTTEGNGNISGTYSYTVGADEALEIVDSLGNTAPFTLYRGGKTIAVTNKATSKQANITGNAEQTVIDVEQGDELIINISTVYTNDFVFEMSYQTETDDSNTDSDADDASESFNEEEKREEQGDNVSEGDDGTYDDNNSTAEDNNNTSDNNNTQDGGDLNENDSVTPENYVVGANEPSVDGCIALELMNKTYTTDVKAGESVYFRIVEGTADYILTVDCEASEITLYAGSSYSQIPYYWGVEIELFMADSDFYISFENTSGVELRFEFSLSFTAL